PYITINSTEMDVGSPFQFTQEEFDAICDDLSQVPIARGVAASSAVPGALTGLTINSHSGTCGYAPPRWFELAEKSPPTDVRRKFQSDLSALIDPNRKYVHLIDGGVADNIGLRMPFYATISTDTLQVKTNLGFSVLRQINNRKITRVAVIVVNAKT